MGASPSCQGGRGYIPTDAVVRGPGLPCAAHSGLDDGGGAFVSFTQPCSAQQLPASAAGPQRGVSCLFPQAGTTALSSGLEGGVGCMNDSSWECMC